jgi:hypothetical protein
MPTLADIIRAKLDAGHLPTVAPPKTWAGYGRGEPCSACGQPVFPAQVEYEFDDGGQTCRLHAGCHGLWAAECRRRGHRGNGSPPPAPAAQPPR